MLWTFAVSFFIVAASMAPGRVEAQTQATGAFLFAYRPHSGRVSDLEAGYRRHLEWHRAHDDSLAWFGWTVVAGPSMGQLVDGTFGVVFRALDERVDPAGDARDLAENVEAFADPTSRALLRLHPEWSTATPLESGSPSPMVQVVRYNVGPGDEHHLEEALSGLRERAGVGRLFPYTVYEGLVGEHAGTYLLFVWRQALADFAEADRDPTRVLRRSLSELAPTLPPGVLTSEQELWLYRPDLTYRPDAGGTP